MYKLTRRILFLAAATAAVTVWLGSASAQDLSRQILYRIPGMDDAQVMRDQTYKTVDGADLKMDVYLPASVAPETRLPAVILVHGGYLWPDDRPKDWGLFTSYGRLMAASGMVGVTFNHRYYGWDEKNLSQSVGDVADAVAYVRSHADSLRVDPQKICLWAFSGGGPHLVVALRERLDYIRCIVAYYAILNAAQFRQTPGGQGLTDEAIERYSPVRYLDAEHPYTPPVLIARAGLDSVDINRSIGEFVTRSLVRGVTIVLENHPAGRHAFDILDDDERTQDIIARTVDFIKANTVGDRLEDSRSAQLLAGAVQLLESGDVAGARKAAETLKTNRRVRAEVLERAFSESALNRTGYGFLSAGQTKQAVAVFEWVADEHPESPNALDSLADGYAADGRKQDAIRIAEKALQLLESAKGRLSETQVKTIRESIEAKLKRLR